MGFSWKDFTIKRFYGLDLKTNIVDVLDGKSLDADNVFIKSDGSPGKRPGDEVMFASDETASIEITEVGTCTILRISNQLGIVVSRRCVSVLRVPIDGIKWSTISKIPSPRTNSRREEGGVNKLSRRLVANGWSIHTRLRIRIHINRS